MMRRTSRGVLGAGVLAVSVFASALGASSAGGAIADGEWGGPGRVGGRTAYNPAAGLGPSELPNLRLQWSSNGGVFTPPVLASGIVVAGDNGGNNAARLRAYELDGGDLLWQKNFGPTATTKIGPPSTNGELVFVTVERDSSLGFLYDLYAYDIGDGTRAWSAELGISGRQIRPREVVVTNTAVLTPTATGNHFTAIAGYTPATGFWRYSRSPGGTIASFAAANGRLFVATDRAGASYDLDIGTPLESLPDIVGAHSMAVTDGALFLATTTRLKGSDAVGAGPRWYRDATAGCRPRVRVVSTLLAIASQHQCAAGLPLVFDRGGGAPGFALQSVAAGDTPIAFGYKVLVAVTATGSLKGWDMRTGSSLGRALSAPATFAPVVVTTNGGPILASKHLVVPEYGALQVFGP
jgi:outer membrane protein assembly factor BamB